MHPAAHAAARDILEATTLFLDRHEEAIQSASPARALEACESLHTGLCSTLAEQVGRVHNGLASHRRESAPEPRDARLFADGLRSTDPLAREAWAFAALRKRMSESEGALLHLRLTLAKGSADGPALATFHQRVHAESFAVRRTLAGVRATLALWQDAVRGETAPHVGSPRALTRAAREALVAGCPEAAGPLLRAALDETMRQPIPMDPEAVSRVRERLEEHLDDDVEAWRLLDFVEFAINVAGMPRA